MKRKDIKSRCPINFTIEIFGDAWSMLIYRDIAVLGKKTFGEFLNSTERIGPSVLAERLVHLEDKGIIAKRPDRKDKRKILYALTETGIEVVPILYEIAFWGTHKSPYPEFTPSWLLSLNYDKQQVITLWQEALRSGDSFLFGQNSVVAKLGLSQRPTLISLNRFSGVANTNR